MINKNNVTKLHKIIFTRTIIGFILIISGIYITTTCIYASSLPKDTIINNNGVVLINDYSIPHGSGPLNTNVRMNCEIEGSLLHVSATPATVIGFNFERLAKSFGYDKVYYCCVNYDKSTASNVCLHSRQYYPGIAFTIKRQGLNHYVANVIGVNNPSKSRIATTISPSESTQGVENIILLTYRPTDVNFKK